MLLPDDDEEKLLLHRVVDGERRGEQLYVCIDDLRTPVPERALRPSPQHGVQPWLHMDLIDALRQLAEAKGLSLADCAKRYATVSLPDLQRGWWWHEVLGFTKVGS